MRERLRAKPHELMMEYVFQPRIQGDLDRSFGNMMRVNMAHTLMFKKVTFPPPKGFCASWTWRPGRK